MKWLRALLLIIVFIILGFLIAAWISSLLLERPSGLAGPGIVVGSGLFGAAGGLLVALVIVSRASRRRIIIINIVVGLLVLIPILFLIGKVKREKSSPQPPKRPTTKPVSLIQNRKSIGLGLASFNIYDKPAVYFYQPNLEKAVNEHLPIDSLAFMRTELGVDISYAPPWFYPEHMKMDYDILFLKVVSKTRDWIQLEGNKQTGRTIWVDAFKVDLVSWSDFFLKVSSVEIIDPHENPIRHRPFTYADPVSVQGSFIYRPIEIRNQWLRVEMLDESLKKQNEGWVKWRSDNQLLLNYSLLH